jgi:putative addiction module component (TIGR02574 family)
MEKLHMTKLAEKLFQDAMGLPVTERAVLIQELMSSLDRPDKEVDELWAQEAEDRLRAFRTGELGAISADEVFNEFGRG